MQVTSSRYVPEAYFALSLLPFFEPSFETLWHDTTYFTIALRKKSCCSSVPFGSLDSLDSCITMKLLEIVDDHSTFLSKNGRSMTSVVPDRFQQRHVTTLWVWLWGPLCPWAGCFSGFFWSDKMQWVEPSHFALSSRLVIKTPTFAGWKDRHGWRPLSSILGSYFGENHINGPERKGTLTVWVWEESTLSLLLELRNGDQNVKNHSACSGDRLTLVRLDLPTKEKRVANGITSGTAAVAFPWFGKTCRSSEVGPSALSHNEASFKQQ